MHLGSTVGGGGGGWLGDLDVLDDPASVAHEVEAQLVGVRRSGPR